MNSESGLSAMAVREIGKSAVLFYDGACGICNAFVGFILDRENRSQGNIPSLFFAPLQGELARRLLSPRDIETLHSAVLHREGQLWYRMDAVRTVLAELRAPWPQVAVILGVLPRPLTDGAYNLVAKYRRRFGGNLQCRRLTPEEQRRFVS